MPYFDYTGFDKSGARINGTIEALDIHQASQQLKKQGLMLSSVVEEQPLQSQRLFSSSSIKLADVEFLTAELSLLLQSGLKIDKGVELLKSANKQPALAKLLNKVSSELRGGKQLSEAFAQFPDAFDSLYINLVSIGERTGKLAEVFSQLAESLAFRRELQKKITQALTYPLVILFVCIASVLFIFNYVVPNMASMFERQQDLPFYTVMLLSSSAWLQKYQLFLFAAFVAIVLLIVKSKHQPAFQKRWQWSVLRLPLLANAILLVERIRFNSGLAMMLKAGVAIDQALDLANGNIKNHELRAEMQIAISKIKRGELLSAALRQTKIYPDFFASLLSVGEESGELAEIFAEIAKRSQRQYTDWVTRFTSLLEPLLILVMGGIVGGVVVIMMLSITSATDVGF